MVQAPYLVLGCHQRPTSCVAHGAVLVKWIRCTVVDRRGFERGQRKWAGLLGEPGFRGQGGGWSRGRQGVAHIFSFWESRAFYDSFMFATGKHHVYTAETDTHVMTGDPVVSVQKDEKGSCKQTLSSTLTYRRSVDSISAEAISGIAGTETKPIPCPAELRH